MATYELNISKAPSGTHKKVKTILSSIVGVEWTYNKPVFIFQCEDPEVVRDALAEIGMALSEKGAEQQPEEVEEAPSATVEAAAPTTAPAPVEAKKATYRAYCTQGHLVFSRGGDVGEATGEELLARHAHEGVTHVDIFSAEGVKTFYS